MLADEYACNGQSLTQCIPNPHCTHRPCVLYCSRRCGEIERAIGEVGRRRGIIAFGAKDKVLISTVEMSIGSPFRALGRREDEGLEEEGLEEEAKERLTSYYTIYVNLAYVQGRLSYCISYP